MKTRYRFIRLSIAILLLNLFICFSALASERFDLNYDLVVIGAGPAGLTAALEARAKGVRVLVIEKRPLNEKNWGLRTRVLTFETKSNDQLNRLGVHSPAEPLEQLEVTTEQLRTQFTTTGNNESIFEKFIGRIPGYHVVVASLENALFQKALEAGVDFKFNTSIENIHQNQNEVMLNLKENGSTLLAKIVIAADGGQSQTGKLLGVSMKINPDFPEFKSLGVDVSLSKPAKAVSTYLVKNITETNSELLAVAFATSEVASVSTRLPESLDRLAEPERTAEITKLVLEQIKKMGLTGKIASPIYQFTIRSAQADRHRVGRVFIIGDAARSINPMSGMGVNLALEDARAVGGKILELMDSNLNNPEFDKVELDLQQNSEKAKHLSIAALERSNFLFKKSPLIHQIIKKAKPWINPNFSFMCRQIFEL